MNVVIVTQEAPLYIASFLENLLQSLSGSKIHIDSIVVYPPIAKNSMTKELCRRIDYYGLITFIKIALFICYEIFLSRCATLFPGMFKCHSVKNAIKKYGIKQLFVESINSCEFIEYVRMRNIDLVVSVAAPEIFKEPVLHAPKKGCINYHTALLPQYRGRQPLFWALLSGENETGVSIHEMDEGLDTGSIIIQRRIPISDNDSLHSLYRKTIAVGSQALCEAIEIVEKGVTYRIPNIAAEGYYYSFPTKQDGIAFRKKGKKFI